MQGPRVSLPKKVNQDARNLSSNVLGNNGQRAIQNGRLLWIAAQVLIAERDLLHDGVIARIQCDRLLQIAQTFFLLAAATQNVAGQLENARIVG